MKRKENTLPPDQFHSLTPSGPGGIPGQAPRTTRTGFHQPQTQQNPRLCRPLLSGEAEGWMEAASLPTTAKIQLELVASQAAEDTHFDQGSFRAAPLCSKRYFNTCSGEGVLPRKAKNCSPKQNVKHEIRIHWEPS